MDGTTDGGADASDDPHLEGACYCDEEGSVWQSGGGACLEALGTVFAWLGGDELRRVSAVCRLWRSVALQPALWRRALMPRATPEHLRAIRRAAAAAQLHTVAELSWSCWSWRREYLLSAAKWELKERHQPSCGATLTHASLSHAGDRLAITADDASLTMWERSEADATTWRRCWQRSERERGWAGAGAVRWAPGDGRLLLAGPLALADRWEIVVLRFDESGQATAEVRAESGSCGGFWVDEAVFVSVTVRLLAPSRAVSTLWLNAAEQKVQSEYAGVTAPVLRIYNESATHISHMIVANVPGEDLEKLKQLQASGDAEGDRTLRENMCCPEPLYWHATLPVRAESWERVVVAAMGVVGGERGVAKALGVWRLPVRAPPPLFAAESLAERVRVRRNQPPPPPEDAPPPSEEELRTLCTPPLTTCRLQCRVLGVQLHPNGGCVWASTRMGAECASLPALRPLLRVSSPGVATPALEYPYLIQPSISDDFIVTPAGDGSGRVRLWTARAGARSAELTHTAPATAALLAAHPQQLIILAGDSLYTKEGSFGAWRRSASNVPPRTSCVEGEVPPCAECVPKPAPSCRTPHRATMSGVRVTCRPPPPAHRPPCAAPLPPCPLTCGQLQAQQNDTHTTGVGATGKRCGESVDRVAQRILAAKNARRLDYEREVAELKNKNCSASQEPSLNYVLGSDREVVRATDGRDYVILSSRTNSQNSQSVQLDPAKDCTIKRSANVDPCTHEPRILLHIDRTDHKETTGDNTKKNHKSSDKHAVSKKVCQKNYVSKLTEWCSSPPELAPEPSRCRQPSLVERLKRRSKSSCNANRKLHTVSFNFQSQTNQSEKSLSETDINAIFAKIKADNEKFDKMINERNELKESGRGRTAGVEEREEPMSSGQLELHVPSGTNRVRLHVGLYAPQKTVTPTQCPPLGNSNVYDAFSAKNDSWLSIKNIQKKFSGCRKDTTAAKNIDTKGSDCQHSTCNKTKRNIPKPEPSPCTQKQPTPVNPCQRKQKDEQSPCNTRPTSSKTHCSSTFEIASNTITSI